ncbi:MAG TPA: hypothetical protein VHY56_13030, partial [Candidatus Binataceae bacterium]|nr:hypothetical protein [Candidatus Binataceae bacterium]
PELCSTQTRSRVSPPAAGIAYFSGGLPLKHLVLILFALVSVGSLYAQQSVTIKEPAEQCYQDLKANLPEAVRWDDAHMAVSSRPLFATPSGDVQLITQIFQEKNDTMCKLVVAIDAPTHSTAWNATNSSTLFRNASLLKARIESAMKAREKADKKK